MYETACVVPAPVRSRSSDTDKLAQNALLCFLLLYIFLKIYLLHSHKHLRNELYSDNRHLLNLLALEMASVM